MWRRPNVPPAKPGIVPIWPFTEKVCQPLVYIYNFQMDLFTIKMACSVESRGHKSQIWPIGVFCLVKSAFFFFFENSYQDRQIQISSCSRIIGWSSITELALCFNPNIKTIAWLRIKWQISYLYYFSSSVMIF